MTKAAAHRSMGEGTLVKRGKVYHARWMVDGKLYVKSTKCSNLRDAEKKLAEFTAPFKTKSDIDALAILKNKIEEKTNASIVKDKPTKIAFLYDKYRSDVSVSAVSAGTERIYDNKLNVFDKFCASMGAAYAHEVTVKIAESFLKDLKKKVNAKTYNSYLCTLRKMFDVVMKHDNNIKVNPFLEFKKLEIDRSHKRRDLTEDELSRLHAAIEGLDLQERILFAFGEYAGMRISDAACCKWSSIDFKEQKLRFLPRKTKTNGIAAVVPIHPKLLEMLLERKKVAGDGEYVIPMLMDKYEKGSIAYFVKRIFTKAKIEISSKDKDSKKWNIETGFHALRHTFASKCVKDMPIQQIQFMLGHSTPMMSLAYTHAKEKDLHLPDFNDDMTTVKIRKEDYEKVVAKQRVNESFADALSRMLKVKPIDFEEIRKKQAEKKAKEEAELDKMLDEVLPS